MPSVSNDTWIVAGAPLLDGQGWRIWYGAPDGDPFTPQPVEVRIGAQQQATTQTWLPHPPVAGLGRQTGICEVRLHTGSPANTTYAIHVPELGAAPPQLWRLWQSALPAEGLSFLLNSCFSLPDERHDSYRLAITQIQKIARPAFQILCGDQLYADWPPHAPWHSAMAKYRSRYTHYWGNAGYQAVLQAMPVFATADDHEYWNDYPEAQVQVPYTWIPAERNAHGVVAAQLYDVFQSALNPGGERWFQFDIAPVSFFVADTRSERTEYGIGANARAVFSANQKAAIAEWFRTLQGPGFLTLGQALMDMPGGGTDKTLPNFSEQYNWLCTEIHNRVTGQTPNSDGLPHSVVILSGDIHTGRHLTATVEPGAAQVHELIGSPASHIMHRLKKEPKRHPGKVTFERQGVATSWAISPSPMADIPEPPRENPTADNNVAMVSLRPRADGVECTFRLYQVRPKRSGPFSWVGAGPAPQPGPPVLYENEKKIILR